LQEVRKASPAPDLDDRDPLPIRRLERLVAGDVDLAQRVPELVLQRARLLERTLTQMAAVGVEDDDFDLP